MSDAAGLIIVEALRKDRQVIKQIAMIVFVPDFVTH